MSNKFVVLLTIKAEAQLTDGDGHIPTMASNNTIYGYEFSGGTDGRGNVEVRQDKTRPATIHVLLDDEQRYTIQEVWISGDQHKQFSSSHARKAKKGAAGHMKGRAKIDDKNTFVASVKFSVVVVDDSNGSRFICDPMIRNIPTTS